MNLRLEGRRPLLWEMVNTCGLRRATVLPRHCLWSHISPGRAGEAGTNEVKVSPDEPCSALGVDRECQFSALGTLCVEGWRKDYCLEGEDEIQETHTTRVYTYEVR